MKPMRVLAVFVVGVMSMVAFWYCVLSGPIVSVRLESENVSDLGFRVTTSGVNGLLGLGVSSETKSEKLWYVDLSYLQDGVIKYGRLPAGPHDQRIPEDGSAPRPIEPGETFVVRIPYQYDHHWAPSAGEVSFRFVVDQKGKATPANRGRADRN
jgi:hypothetical protein